MHLGHANLKFSSTLSEALLEGALEGQLLLPVEPMAVFYGKALGNTLFLSLLVIVLAPAAVVFYSLEVAPLAMLKLAAVWSLTAAGLSAPGTLYAAMTSQVRGQDVLLPIVHYPLVIPVLLSSVKAMDLVMNGDPMGQMFSWTAFLTVFSVVYCSSSRPAPSPITYANLSGRCLASQRRRNLPGSVMLP